MTDRSQYEEALQRVSSSDYNWQHGYPKGASREAAVAQALAMLAVADELRRLNERGDRFNASLLEFFERLTEDPGDVSSLRSEQSAAAPGCPVCGNVNVDDGEECLFGDITRTEWLTHRQHFFEKALSFRTEYGAGLYADQRMRLDFGPCPEES